MGALTPQPPGWIHSAPVQLHASRDIEATADEVFAALADHESWPEWFDAIKSVERFGEPAEGIGSHRRVFINDRVSVDEEFIVWEPGKEWGFTILSASVRGLKSMNELVTIQELGAGRVRVTYKMGIAPGVALAPIVRLAKGQLRKNLGRALDNLGPHIAGRRAS
ncbi:MAG: SRPBCC family protein [Acidimicrobiales bacterium]